MAKIHEELILIKLSTLTKNNNDEAIKIVNDEIVSTIEQITQELVDEKIIVEVSTEHGTD